MIKLGYDNVKSDHDFFTCFKDYYKVLEVDYDATNEKIKLNYRRLALVSDRSSFSSFLDGAYKFFLLKNINGNLMKILLSVHRSGIPTSIRVTMLLQKNFNWSMKLIKVIFLFVASQMVCILHASQMTCIPACYMMRNLHFFVVTHLWELYALQIYLISHLD